MSDNGHARAPKDMPGFLNWLRNLARGRSELSLRESLEDIIDEHDEGAADTPANLGEREMLRNLLEFGEMTVDDVMVPRADIYAVQDSISLDKLIETFLDSGHSRLVVFGESLDDVTGMVHVRDVLRFWSKRESFTMAAILRPVLFVPPSLSLADVLAQIQARRCHLAIVVDEYGGTDGLVTIEDLVEEIVGDIEDEHDEQESPMFTVGSDGVVDADARATVEEIEQVLGQDLLSDDLDEEIDTIGGLVVSFAGRVPEAGERLMPIEGSGLEFEVVDADPRMIRRLRIYHTVPTDAVDD
ncbi:hemolysin family protein [Zavarzinia compransoris]|uniref:hemolysin family protein n=1 Tax=Zavarzinia marina TaxID=2911065 RepID=UPI001F4110FC|nr:hemolysin family protein [Zavarzinia marina]MCF4165439.1 hemolysin family protein [Zavarzinia marina]